MPTPKQERAVNFGDGKLLILACAGSGKTETITRRIARLIADGVPPESIVAFTFTNRAADEMASRVRQHLSDFGREDAFSGLNIGTIHSYCRQRLTQILPKYLAFDLLQDENDDMRPLFCLRHAEELGIEALGEYYIGTWRRLKPFDILHDFCRNVDLVRDERIKPDKLTEPFRGCYLAYLGLLDKQHFLDFGSMIALYVEALERDPGLRALEQRRVRHLIVDEYQDVNTLQEALIQLMVGAGGNLCVVGDDDQCIYNWRGSNVENIRTFMERNPNAKKIEIEQNFRSTPGIIAAAETVIGLNDGRLGKAMGPWEGRQGETVKGDIAAHFFPTEAAEVDAIIEQLRLLEGWPYVNNKGERSALRFSDMAVLMRTVRGSAQPLLDALGRAGIEALVKGGKLFDRLEVRVAMQAFSFLGGSPDFPDGDQPGLPELMASYEDLDWPEKDPALFQSAMVALQQEVEDVPAFSVQWLFHRIVQAMGGDRALLPDTWYYNLGRLSQLVTGFEHVYPQITLDEISSFLDYVNFHAVSLAEEGSAGEQALEDPVTVSTVHKAKGCQFPVVFMPVLNAGEFPAGWALTEKMWFIPTDVFSTARYTSKVDDERRLFYVGITRSEKYLYLSGHRMAVDDPSPKEPSPFYNEYPMDKKLGGPFPVAPAAVEETAGVEAPPRPSQPVETSWSDLRYYAACPFGYQLRRVYGFDPIPKEDVGYGRAVHNVLAALHREAMDGGLDSVDIRGLVDEHMVMRFAPQETRDRVREAIIRYTSQYIQRSQDDLSRIAGIEQPFRAAIGDGLVAGQMDLLLDDGDGIEIRDFKVSERGASKSRQEAERQLQLYALAAATLPPEVRQGREISKASIYHFDTGTTAEVPVGPAALAAAREELEGMIAGLRGPEFPFTDDRERCAGCDWGLICCGKPQG